jgi:FkbM family methyltransferase
MSTISSAKRRMIWILRNIFGVTSRSVAESVWRVRNLAAAAPRTPGTISWQGTALQYSDAPAVLSQLSEILLGGCYDFNSTKPSPRILDCGAHVGIGVRRWREQFPTANITAFEADPEIASLLKQNLKHLNDQQTKVVHAAAWVSNGSIGFKRTGADNGHVSAQSTDLIPSRDLSEFCSEPIDLLKLDIEGAEEAVLNHLDKTGALNNVQRLICEWHEWTTASPTLHRALERLVANGFVYRISGAGCLGNLQCPAFPRLAWAGNHMIIHAWRATAK